MNQPPDQITLTWCDRCGSTNRYKSLRQKHYSNGTLCSGQLFDVTYQQTGAVR